MKKPPKSHLILILLGIAGSFLMGIVLSQLFSNKTLPVKENMYWKFIAIYYVIVISYLTRFFGTKNYMPILPSLVKFMTLTMFFSLPYTACLVFLGGVPISTVFSYLPAQLIVLALVFIWHVTTEIDPAIITDTKVWIKGAVIVGISSFMLPALELPFYVGFSLAILPLFCYTLLLLRRAIKNKS